MTTKEFSIKNINIHLLLSAASFAWFWLAIGVLCVLLIGSALFYQHVLKTYPCEICIYVRVWIVGIGLLAFFTIFLKKWPWMRAFACFSGLLLSLGLASETWNLLVVEYAIGDGGACSMFANFPNWAPLDRWLPAMFEVQGFCAATPEIFLGFTMAHSLVLVSAGFIVVFSVSLVGALLKS